MNILSLSASPSGERSSSRQLADSIIERILLRHPHCQIKRRDLSSHAPSHWTGAQVAASFTPASERTLEQNNLLLESDALCAELLSSDWVIVATPMWNFSIPSCLKAWIDHISRKDVTFRYGPRGPIGLASRIQKVIIVESAGSSYAHPPLSEMNHVGPYLRQVFTFLGASGVEVISAFGTAIDPQEAVQNANRRIPEILGMA